MTEVMSHHDLHEQERLNALKLDEDLRRQAQEEQAQIENHLRESTSDEAWSRLSISEREKLVRKEVHRIRKERQQERHKIEIRANSQRQLIKAQEFMETKENEGRKRSASVASNLYEEEERIRKEQFQRLLDNKPVNESSHEKLKGFDAEIAERISSKIDPDAERRACVWISQLTGETMFDFSESLKSGIILCKLVNAIKPKTILKYNERPIPLMERDNIKLYLEACERLGLTKQSLFSIADLHDARDLNLVLQNVFSLSRLASTFSDYSGPLLQERKVGATLVRSRTEDGLSGRFKSITGNVKSEPPKQLNPNYISSAPEVRHQMENDPEMLKKRVKQLETELKEEQKFSKDEIAHLKKENTRLKQELEDEVKLAPKKAGSAAAIKTNGNSNSHSQSSYIATEHSFASILQQRTNAAKNMLVDVHIAFLLKQYLLEKSGTTISQ